jgi:hypothetical protein
MTAQAPTSPFEPTREEKATTLREMHAVISPEAGGRFAKPSPPVDPAKLYAPLPASSPWHCDPVPDEEPLGFSVEEMPVMGEPWEAERAAAIADSVAASSPATDTAPSSPRERSVADLSSPSGSANSASLIESPAVGGADPTLGSNSGPQTSSFAGTSNLAASSADAEVAPKSEGADIQVEHRRGEAALSWRRFG